MASNPGFEAIEHIVVLMLENRSLDNQLGWLYSDQGNRPPRNIPTADPPTYDGLIPNTYYNLTDLEHPDQAEKIFATRGTEGTESYGPFTVPNPDPNEGFRHMTRQIFGAEAPTQGIPPEMSGYVVDYQTAKGNSKPNANSIMQSYSPEQVGVISSLARHFAVSDRWFASTPTETLPNRGFVHAGTSLGRVNDFALSSGIESLFGIVYNTPTVFGALQNAGISWGIYCDETIAGTIPLSLTAIQMQELWHPSLSLGNIHRFETFQQRAADGTLPTYSFLEPSWVVEPNDQLPPNDVCAGEELIHRTWQAVSTGKNWQNTLLVVTYDENGGCYDHVPTPWGAVPPDEQSNPGDQEFDFRRFGVRIPTLLISPWVEAGTVFRSPGPVPFDHTSILATLFHRLGLERSCLPSRRLAVAPTFDEVLSRQAPRQEVPDIELTCTSETDAEADLDRPAKDLHLAFAAVAEHHRRGRHSLPSEVRDLFEVRCDRRRVKEILEDASWAKGWLVDG